MPCPVQPNKELNKVTLTKDFRRVAKSIKKNTADNFYRPDLCGAALAKWSLLHFVYSRNSWQKRKQS